MSTGSEKSCSLEKNNSRTALNSNPFECQKEGRVFSLLPVDLFRYSGQVLDILGKRSFLGKAPGDYFREEIDKAIHIQDKLLLILSQQSVASKLPKTEIHVN